MIGLVDADLVAFRCAATVTEEEPLDVALYRVDVLMRQILEGADASEYKAYLTGRGNFRKKINPEYKANRKDKEPPCYLQQCREYLIKEWNAIVSEGCEADDLLGINQTSETIICSLDKDLDMIPGQHYNWTRVESYYVNKQDGIRHLYKQMLIGDKSDNIVGVDRIGPVKAAKLIDHLNDEQEMFDTVYYLYNNPERFVMNANCLWIQREENEYWVNRQNLILPKECELVVEASLEFMKSLNQTTSMELTTTTGQTSGSQYNGTGTDTTQTNNQPWT
jgi:5'-3' exonuclease